MEIDIFFFCELTESGSYCGIESAVVEFRGPDGVDLLFDPFNLALEGLAGFSDIFQACFKIKGFELFFEFMQLGGKGNGQRADAGVKAHGYFFSFVFSGGEDGGGEGKSDVLGVGGADGWRGRV